MRGDRFATTVALPYSETIDLEEVRIRALTQLYTEAVKSGAFPVGRPKVELRLGSALSTYGERPALRAEVEVTR